jgi:glycosyltransferase involved in cell wall biosynthesis
MAFGKPVVQFDLTEGRFSAQEASLYAEKNNELDLARKIIQLLDDPEARARMGFFGRNRVETELEWKYEAPRLLRAYDAAFAPR